MTVVVAMKLEILTNLQNGPNELNIQNIYTINHTKVDIEIIVEKSTWIKMKMQMQNSEMNRFCKTPTVQIFEYFKCYLAQNTR